MNTNIHDVIIFCVNCAGRHKLADMLSKPFFKGETFFCPEASDDDSMEMARSDGERVVYWNGRQFEEVHSQ